MPTSAAGADVIVTRGTNYWRPTAQDSGSGNSFTHYESISRHQRSRDGQDPVHPTISNATFPALSAKQLPDRDTFSRAGCAAGSSALAVNDTVNTNSADVSVKAPIHYRSIDFAPTCDIH